MAENRKKIETREDVQKLVHTFYGKIQKDEILGPIFDLHLSAEDWPPHLVKMTNFWETSLLGARNFMGNPPLAHMKVDENLDYQFEQRNFAIWLRLWIETLDQLFIGEKVESAKEGARRMSTGLYLAMWTNRPENRLL